MKEYSTEFGAAVLFSCAFIASSVIAMYAIVTFLPLI